MVARILDILQQLCSRLRTGVRAAVCPVTGIFLISVMMGVALSGTARAVTPFGTTIANTANFTFTVNAISGQLASSNTETFQVQGLGPDMAEMTVTDTTPANIRLAAGDAMIHDIDLINVGDNDLVNGRLLITMPAGSTMSLNAGTLLSSTTDAVSGTTTYTYSVQDLGFFETLNLQSTLAFPVNLAAGAYDVSYRYQANGLDIVDATSAMTVQSRTVATLALLQYDIEGTATTFNQSSYDDGSGSFLPLPAPAHPQDSGQLVTDMPVTVVQSDYFGHHQTLFIRVTDADQNTDIASQDTIVVVLNNAVAGDTETVRLQETANNSGIFTGYISMTINPATSNDGILSVHADARVTVSYTDDVDGSESMSSEILVDPYGRVFDSETGALLDDYTVHLINAVTGLHAQVFGDDGVSTYPATVVTGGRVTDSSGRAYNFAPGSYRFPLIAPGKYKLVVIPPDGAYYRWPSQKSDAQMAMLANAPFALTVGSRGEAFQVEAGPPLRIDMPADPLATQLFVRRSASKQEVAAGDFLQFAVAVENTATVVIYNGILTDSLPQGFRYRAGSALLDGNPLTDPVISADGRTLTFSLGNLAASTNYDVSYVTEVGAARTGHAPSSSQATGNNGAITSNISRVVTRVKEDLMRSYNILAGRVVVMDENGEPGKEGLPGVRIYLEDGRYVVTDEHGMYHFEGVKAGTHVIQLDTETLPLTYEAVAYEKNTRFAGRAWSRFVDLQGGTLWQVDFYTRNTATPEGHAGLQIHNQPQPRSDMIRYDAEMKITGVPVANMRLILMLPEGAIYQPGSSQLDGTALEDPEIRDGTLSYRLPEIRHNWNGVITFDVRLTKDLVEKPLTAKGMLVFDTTSHQGQRTSVAEHSLPIIDILLELKELEFALDNPGSTAEGELSDEDKRQLDILAARINGYYNIQALSLNQFDHNANRNTLDDAHKARIQQVVRYLQDKLDINPEQFLINNNTYADEEKDTQKGDGLQLRVDTMTQRLQFSKDAVSGQMIEARTEGGVFTDYRVKAPPARKAPEKRIVYDESWLATAGPGLEWLSPAENDLPAIPSVTTAIKHDHAQKVKLLLNGEVVPDVNFDGIARNRERTALSRWSGVDLIEGDNHFEAIILDKDGNEVSRMDRTIHYSSPPVRVEYLKTRSVLTADGLTTPVIALRLTDKDGYPARRDVKGEFHIKAPYRPERSGQFDSALLPGSPAPKNIYTVDDDGLVMLRLEPTSKSGDVEITLPLSNGDHKVAVHLNSPVRDWILVGFAEGTLGYNRLNGSMEDLPGKAADENIYKDGQIAFYGKGRVKGEWLLTLAYDSDKENLRGDPSLFQTIDPGTYYTVYGDSSRQDYDAASRENLYLKIERDDFFALFGDYMTELNKSQLAPYNRALTGLKSRYQDERYDIVVFASESDQAFIRDEIRGKGISGTYQLSRRDIVINSEQIVIETRDRFRSEVIIERRELARHTDYDIDYQNGTVNFRLPVAHTSTDLNHVFIVANYESYDVTDSALTYGGHIETSLDDRTTLGLTHINEGRTGGKAQLSGADVAYQLNKNTQLRAELASSSNSDNSGSADGDAYLTEVDHKGENWDGRAYLQQTDSGYGLNQTSGAANGTRKIGVEASTQATDSITVTGQMYRNENLDSNTVRDLVEAQGTRTAGKNTLRLGMRSAVDELGDGSRQQSRQLTAGASRRMLEDKLSLRIDREQSIGDAASVDFPTRTVIGADYALTDKTALIADQEWTDGDTRDTRTTRLGLKTQPWQGGEVYSGVRRSLDNDSDTTAADASLKQTLEINEFWSADFGLEKNETLSDTPVAPFDADVPFANAASNDFTATSVGLSYNPGDWTWQNRFEIRNADNEDSWRVATSAQTSPNRSLSMLGSMQLSSSDTAAGQFRRDTKVRLDVAYRPPVSRWMALNRLELITETSGGGDFGYDNWRVINNLNTSYRIRQRLQMGLQYGVKYVQETIEQQKYNSVTDLYGLEARYDINETWDLGAQASILHSWKTSQADYSTGVSVGHSFMDNVWLSLGYNFIGFRDRDFSMANNTSEGVYMKFRIKFDQVSMKEALKWVD